LDDLANLRTGHEAPFGIMEDQLDIVQREADALGPTDKP